MTARRSFLLAAPVLAALALTAACNNNADARAGAAGGSPGGKVTGPEFVLGNAKAPVTVVEYLSVTCSHCAHFSKTSFQDIKKQYIDTGKVKWVFREFLTSPEQAAAAGWVLARCAGREKYYGVMESLFNTQDQLFKTGDIRGWIVNVGKAAGMDDAKITACLGDDAAYKDLDARFQKAVNVDKVSGTPTFIVNGKEIKAGETIAGERFNGTDLDPKKFAAVYAAAGGK